MGFCQIFEVQIFSISKKKKTSADYDSCTNLLDYLLASEMIVKKASFAKTCTYQVLYQQG